MAEAAQAALASLSSLRPRCWGSACTPAPNHAIFEPEIRVIRRFDLHISYTEDYGAKMASDFNCLFWVVPIAGMTSPEVIPSVTIKTLILDRDLGAKLFGQKHLRT